MSSVRMIFVEDDKTFSKVMTKELSAAGFEVKAFADGKGVVACVRSFRPEVALVDLKLAGESGMDLLARLKEEQPDLQVVMLTGHGGIPDAVDAMRLGAYDFLVKPTRLDVLEQTLRKAAATSRLIAENERLRRVTVSQSDPLEIVGTSRAIVEVRELIDRIAPVDEAVLIEGENGTGKELIARRLHRLSSRHDRPCVTVNCGAIPADLVESELFGHERGAFTGADRRKLGLFEAADGGTLILDEVGELPPAVQPTLLRALQFGEIRRVGSTDTIRVDVRILAATNRDLAAEVRSGRFREDLYFRLSTFRIRAPTLRERREDIPALANVFLATASRRAGRRLALDETALRALSEHDWAGNVRELESAIIRLSVLAEGEVLDEVAVGRVAFGPLEPASTGLPTLRLADLERRATLDALAKHQGNKQAAADELGVSLRTLYNKLKLYEESE